MSIEAVSNVLQFSRAKGRAKLVLLGIANHLGDHGSWPSISTLAKYANASERSVKRDIQELVELGELIVELQAAPTNSQYKTNLYWITLDLPGVTNSAAGVTNQVTRGDTIGTQTINRTIKEDKNKVGTRIPENFEVTDAMRDWAAKETPSVDLELQTANFRDYWASKAKDATKLDWVAAWRTWMRNDEDRKSRLKPSGRVDREKANEALRRLYEAEEQND